MSVKVDFQKKYDSVFEHKRWWRSEIKRRAAELSEGYFTEASAKIAENLLSLDSYVGAETVMLYLNMGVEPKTEELIEHMLLDGKIVCVPLCVDKEKHLMVAKLYEGKDALVSGAYGIKEPRAEAREIAPESIDLVVAPCVSCDDACRRLGHGAGYYDRFLNKTSCPTVALCFEMLMASELPYDEYDVTMNAVITEDRIYRRKNMADNKKIMLTGDRPSGRLHIGHYVGSLAQRLELQDNPDFEKIFVMLADAQALTDNFDNPEKVRESVFQVAIDYLSVGIDPKKTSIFIQSEVPQLHELTIYYMNLVTVARAQRNPTIKTEIQLRGFGDSVPMGFLNYPISQASDITFCRATTVPVGEDQEPLLEQCREIVRKFNSIYGEEVLVEPEIYLSDNKACRRLPGTDGQAKMSKSLGNTIYLSDSEDELKKKVMSMYTDPGHLRIEDPGKIEGNTVFTYLDCFCKDSDFEKYLPEYKNLDELKAHYRRGGLGDVKCKKFLFRILNDFLTPIRERRSYYEAHPEEVIRVLIDGTMEARRVAKETMADIKKAMHIDYFEQWEEKYGIKAE